MRNRVRYRTLRNAKEDHFHFLRQPRYELVTLDQDGYRRAVATGRRMDAKRCEQPVLLECGRVQLRHHVTDVDPGLLQQRLNIVESRAHGGQGRSRQLLAQDTETDV